MNIKADIHIRENKILEFVPSYFFFVKTLVLTTTRVIIFVCKDKVQGLQNDVLLIFQGQTWMHLYITLFSNNSQD